MSQQTFKAFLASPKPISLMKGRGFSVDISHTAIADLNVHQIKKLGLPPVYPHRLRVETRGPAIHTSFFPTQWIIWVRNSDDFTMSKEMALF